MSETCLICNHERFQHEEYGCDVFGCACPRTANDVSDLIIDELRQDKADLLEALKALVKCPRISGMGAQIRVDAKEAGREDELKNARALIARLEER